MKPQPQLFWHFLGDRWILLKMLWVFASSSKKKNTATSITRFQFGWCAVSCVSWRYLFFFIFKVKRFTNSDFLFITWDFRKTLVSPPNGAPKSGTPGIIQIGSIFSGGEMWKVYGKMDGVGSNFWEGEFVFLPNKLCLRKFKLLKRVDRHKDMQRIWCMTPMTPWVARNQSNIEQLLLKPPKFWKASWQDIHGTYHGFEKRNLPGIAKKHISSNMLEDVFWSSFETTWQKDKNSGKFTEKHHIRRNCRIAAWISTAKITRPSFLHNFLFVVLCTRNPFHGTLFCQKDHLKIGRRFPIW